MTAPLKIRQLENTPFIIDDNRKFLYFQFDDYYLTYEYTYSAFVGKYAYVVCLQQENSPKVLSDLYF